MYGLVSEHVGLRLRMVWDKLHRIHNDIYLGCAADPGMKQAILLTTVVYNLQHGPWSGSAFHEKLKAEAVNFFATASLTDPLFVHFLDKINATLEPSEVSFISTL